MPPYTFSTLNAIPPQVFSITSVYSIVFMCLVAAVAYFSANHGLSKRATVKDRYTWMWLVRLLFKYFADLQLMAGDKTFDAMTHFSWEAIFLWNSICGRTAFGGSGILVDMGESTEILDAVVYDLIHNVSVKEYALADYRWGMADPTM